MSPTSHDTLPLLSSACPDNASVLALSVARFVAAAYVTGDAFCFDTAFEGAEKVLGAERGQDVVARMIGVIRAMRAERVAEWQFLPATCCRMTRHECQLVEALTLVRGEGRRVAGRAAQGVVGHEAPRLATAIAAAAEALNRVAVSLEAVPSAEAPRRPAGRSLH